MDTGQKTESIYQLLDDITKDRVALPEFQRDFVWDIEKTFDLFDSFVRDIFTGSLIYGVPSFDITVRELDKRPRSGKGARAKLAIKSYTRPEIEARIKINGFRLLLDGQQRATSIFRALSGIDPVYFIAQRDDELPADVLQVPVGQRAMEQVLKEFRGEPVLNHVSILLHDVYKVLRGEASREREKATLFLSSNHIEGLTFDNVESSVEFLNYLTQMKSLENLCRQEKLVSYYLLDTDEDKFALFFERSNSKGLQLNFIDILAAKLYAGFNLRSKIEEFEDENPNLKLNREVLVRIISFHVSQGKDMGRSFILSKLSHTDFTAHWGTYTSAYKSVYDFLLSSKLLIHQTWIPYENMLIPLMAFAEELPHQDFSQMNDMQATMLRTWYWLAIFSRRYSSAAQTFALDDAQAMKKAGKGDFTSIVTIINRMQPIIRTKDDLLNVHKKYDAAYKGVLNMINYAEGGYLNLQNNHLASTASNLEDHHIFPHDYLKKHWAAVHDTLDSEIAIDCVVNRTLIPKLTNIKVSNKKPSKHLSEIKTQNSKIEVALKSHLIGDDLMDGKLDEHYDDFLAGRANKILAALDEHVLVPRQKLAAS